MVEIKGLRFDTSIGVLFALKEARGHTTLQETCAAIGRSNIDNMLEVLCISHAKAEKQALTQDEFLEKLGAHGIGFLKVSSIFSEVTQKLLFDGMSTEEVENAKKLAMSQVQNKKE